MKYGMRTQSALKTVETSIDDLLMIDDDRWWIESDHEAIGPRPSLNNYPPIIIQRKIGKWTKMAAIFTSISFPSFLLFCWWCYDYRHHYYYHQHDCFFIVWSCHSPVAFSLSNCNGRVRCPQSVETTETQLLLLLLQLLLLEFDFVFCFCFVIQWIIRPVWKQKNSETKQQQRKKKKLEFIVSDIWESIGYTGSVRSPVTFVSIICLGTLEIPRRW